jgi:hypothetical protein
VKVWANEESDRAPCLKGDDGRRPAIQEHLAQRETTARDRPYREQRSRDDCTLSAVRGTGARILVRAASAWSVPWRMGVAKRSKERDWSGAHSYERPPPPRPKNTRPPCNSPSARRPPPAARRPRPHHDLTLCCPGRPAGSRRRRAARPNRRAQARARPGRSGSLLNFASHPPAAHMTTPSAAAATAASASTAADAPPAAASASAVAAGGAGGGAEGCWAGSEAARRRRSSSSARRFSPAAPKARSAPSSAAEAAAASPCPSASPAAASHLRPRWMGRDQCTYPSPYVSMGESRPYGYAVTMGQARPGRAVPVGGRGLSTHSDKR